MHTSYVYETGPNQTQVFPYTQLDGFKNVTLWIWNGIGCPNQLENYVLFRPIAINIPWALRRCTWEQEHYDIPNIPPWWYFIQIDVHIESLAYSPDGLIWVQLWPEENPFYCTVLTYREKMIVTSRYDFCGMFWKPCPPAAPKYQVIPDLKVNVKGAYACAQAFGSRPGYPNWNPACDFNNDGKVDVKDYYALSQNFGWAAPMPNMTLNLTHTTLGHTNPPQGIYSYSHNSQVTITAIPDPNCMFDHWELDGVIVSPSPGDTITITMNQYHHLHAVFTIF